MSENYHAHALCRAQRFGNRPVTNLLICSGLILVSYFILLLCQLLEQQCIGHYSGILVRIHAQLSGIFIHLQNATFQLVLATDGIYSVVMFLYDEDMEISSETVIGFATGTLGTFYQMNQIRSVQTGSNAGLAGLWMFRTDGGRQLTWNVCTTLSICIAITCMHGYRPIYIS